MRVVLVFLFVLLAKFHVYSVKVDMGQCSCNCGSTTGSTLSSQFLGGTQDGKFYESIRGFKGEIGRPGDVGLGGTNGVIGSKGLRGPPAVDTSKHQPEGTFSSCADLLSEGIVSGVYQIKPRGTSKVMQVYCETAAAGGGWTLVASVHENNIYGKCTVGDNWSNDQGISQRNNFTIVSNWENFKTFGHPEAATSSDYKSAAYFSSTGDDVMVWHVPNDSEMSQWSSLATLKYFTNNHFLSNYGGTLQSLYSKYFQMKRISGSGATYAVQTIGDTFQASSSAVRALVPNFHLYTYDSTTNLFISDGGSDMYDTGNRVFYKIGSANYKQITYGEKYIDYATGTQVYSRKTHPFITHMWIPNTAGQVSSFSIKVTSGTGADTSGQHSSDSSFVTIGNFTCKYNAYHVYSAGSDPSICEVYFYCYSEELWNSVPAASFTRTAWSSATDNIANAVTIDGSPRSVLLAYTLLSRSGSAKVSNEQIRAVLTRMISDLRTVTTFPGIDCSRSNESLAVPVQYIEGSNDTIMADIPTSQKPVVDPGFIHFRPIDPQGRPNAICPGIKSRSCTPSYLCAGGIGVEGNETTEVKQACGDFAGWQGTQFDNATDTVPSGLARPLNNLEQTLLIFTR